MIFENPKAFEYYKQITEEHGVPIDAPAEMVFTEKEGQESLAEIIKRNYRHRTIDN